MLNYCQCSLCFMQVGRERLSREAIKTSYRATMRVSGTLRQKTEWPVHRQKARWGTLKYKVTMGELRWFSPIPLDLYRWVFKRLVIPFGRVPASHTKGSGFSAQHHTQEQNKGRICMVPGTEQVLLRY